MALDLVSTLQDLVRLPSVNPMGRPLSGDIHHEHRVTDFLQALFTDLGVSWQRQTVHPRRDNILARLDGAVSPERGGPVLMLEAHQDTVPVDGMTIPPWEAGIREGRVWGRGACDVKGGMAAMLWAFSRLSELPASDRPTVLMACSVNEEHGSDGARELATLWTDPGRRSSLVPRRPDAVIVAEPTALDVVVAHKGAVRWRIRTTGRAAHGSRPHEGENAVYRMTHVVRLLERYAAHEVGALAAHPLVGSPTLNVGLIGGGIGANTVPDECFIDVDRRVIPGEDAGEARQHVIDHLEAFMPAGPALVHDAPLTAGSGLNDDINGPLAERLAAAARPAGGGRKIGVAYGTNAPRYASTGVPTVVFGPGSIEQAHTVDEWIEIDEVARCGEVLLEFARRW